MTDVLLYHHALGLTAGVHAIADRLRAAGHRVTTPDVFGGRTYGSLDEAMEVVDPNFDSLLDTAVDAAGGAATPLVCVGFSFGATAAQRVAQTRPGVVAAALFHAAAPPTAFSPDGWPAGVALQVHVAADDPWVELDEAEALVAAAGDLGELFVYPGSAHLFTDPTLDVHDPAIAEPAMERLLALLARLDA